MFFLNYLRSTNFRSFTYFTRYGSDIYKYNSVSGLNTVFPDPAIVGNKDPYPGSG